MRQLHEALSVPSLDKGQAKTSWSSASRRSGSTQRARKRPIARRGRFARRLPGASEKLHRARGAGHAASSAVSPERQSSPPEPPERPCRHSRRPIRRREPRPREPAWPRRFKPERLVRVSVNMPRSRHKFGVVFKSLRELCPSTGDGFASHIVPGVLARVFGVEAAVTGGRTGAGLISAPKGGGRAVTGRERGRYGGSRRS